MLLNCTVRNVDGDPIMGIPIYSFYLAEPSKMYFGYSNSAGEVRFWSCPGSNDYQQYSIICPQGSKWRIFFQIPYHPFSGISADLCIPLHGTTDANANITLNIAPGMIAFSNGAFIDVSPQQGLDSPSFGRVYLSQQRSSSSGSISNISTFSLGTDFYGSDVLLLSDIGPTILSRYFSAHSPGMISDAGSAEGQHVQPGMEEDN